MNDQQTTVAELKGIVQRFVDERDWQEFHDPKNLAMSIAIETAELMEHFQWLRSDELEDAYKDQGTAEMVREEIADILCYLLSIASTLDVDLSSALADKMTKNRSKYPVDKFRGNYR